MIENPVAPENILRAGTENCRWEDSVQQGRNTSRNVFVEIGGETRCLSAWAEFAGLGYDTVYARYAKGKQGIDLIAPVKGVRDEFS